MTDRWIYGRRQGDMPQEYIGVGNKKENTYYTKERYKHVFIVVPSNVNICWYIRDEESSLAKHTFYIFGL